MFGQRQSYFSRLARSYPMLKLVDVYDHQSFIREYVLDNVYVCLVMYFLFYVAVWYANKAIKRIEKANQELMSTVVGNRTKLDDVMAMKDKRTEYEEIVVKAKGAQKITAKHLDNEMKRLSTELMATANKMSELETILSKCKFWEKSSEEGIWDGASAGECAEGTAVVKDSIENVKILEPSFPPTLPPEPPPRNYGIFVTRPPGRRSSAVAKPPPTKVRLKQ